MSVQIVSTRPALVASFSAAVDAVARERRYLTFVEGPPLESSEAFVASLLAGEGVQFLAVDEPDRVVGWCDIARIPFEGHRHCGRLGMGLLPAYRGLGLGARLASATIAEAKRSGIAGIELDVFASNARAIRLYERLGFVREGRKRRARFLDGRYDAIQMAILVNDPAR